MNHYIDIQDFLKVSIHTGTVVSAERNEKAKTPAYIMKIDFGEEIGVKSTSAQITAHYKAEELSGTQVVAVTNFPALRIAGVKSEVLVLGIVRDDGVYY